MSPAKLCRAVVFAFLVSHASIACSSPEPGQHASGVSESIIGVYAAVTESEWSQELRLSGDRTAQLTTSAWIAGKADSATTLNYSGTWVSRGDTVTLRLLPSGTSPDELPHIFSFRYFPQLSLKEIGRRESVPGLTYLTPSRISLVRIAGSMWRKDALQKIFANAPSDTLADSRPSTTSAQHAVPRQSQLDERQGAQVTRDEDSGTTNNRNGEQLRTANNKNSEQTVNGSNGETTN